MEEGERGVLDGEAALMLLDDIARGRRRRSRRRRARDTIRERGRSQQARGMFQMLVNDIRSAPSVTLDQPALNAVTPDFQ